MKQKYLISQPFQGINTLHFRWVLASDGSASTDQLHLFTGGLLLLSTAQGCCCYTLWAGKAGVRLCCLPSACPWESALEDLFALSVPVNLLPEIQREWVNPCKESYHLWVRLSPTAPYKTPSRRPEKIMPDFRLRDGLTERDQEREGRSRPLHQHFSTRRQECKTICSKPSCTGVHGNRCYRQHQHPPVGTLQCVHC